MARGQEFCVVDVADVVKGTLFTVVDRDHAIL